MSVAIVLPARLASTRLPGKLLLNRTGRTVLEHTIDQALEAQRRAPGLIQTICAACDAAELLEVARHSGIQAVMTSPAHKSGTDRIAEAAANLKETIIVNLQADEPEIDPGAIVQVAELLSEKKSGEAAAPMATLAVPIFDPEIWKRPNVVKVVVDAQGRALYFSRAPIPFIREEAERSTLWTLKNPAGYGQARPVYGLHHLGLYAYRREFLLAYSALPPSRLEKLEKLEQLRALEAGHTIRVGLADSNPPGIDTPEEYEAFVSRWKSKNSESRIQNQEPRAKN